MQSFGGHGCHGMGEAAGAFQTQGWGGVCAGSKETVGTQSGEEPGVMLGGSLEGQAGRRPRSLREDSTGFWQGVAGCPSWLLQGTDGRV